MKKEYQTGVVNVVFALDDIQTSCAVYSFTDTVYCHQCVAYSVLIIIHLLQPC